MGKRNSSRTRVAPVFDALLKRDPSGSSWLTPLMALGSRSADVGTPSTAQLIAEHGVRWGAKEERLLPPKRLLQWLVEKVKPGKGSLGKDPTTRDYRRKLLERDPATQALARQLLDGKYRPAWYVLEGPSWPDAFLESEKFVLVIEGKRTEAGSTTTTTWMTGRNQLLRHMDAALNAQQENKAAKQVFGLMIVDEEGPTPMPAWLAECAEVTSAKTLADSLPHLSESERHSLASGFLGVTTWQSVCREL